jgi:hypothetical protein
MNPVQFEVIWHRILQIADEMGIHYLRCSGSQTVVSGNDGATAVMLPDGGLVAIGPYIATQSNVLPLIVESTKRTCSDNPGKTRVIFLSATILTAGPSTTPTWLSSHPSSSRARLPPGSA